MGINLYLMTLSGIITKFKYQKIIAKICYQNLLVNDSVEIRKMQKAPLVKWPEDIAPDDAGKPAPLNFVVCCN